MIRVDGLDTVVVQAIIAEGGELVSISFDAGPEPVLYFKEHKATAQIVQDVQVGTLRVDPWRFSRAGEKTLAILRAAQAEAESGTLQ